MAALKVETSTWVRDSHDLFDYEADQLERKRFYLWKAGRLFRQHTDVRILREGDKPPPHGDYLFSVKPYRDGKYQITPAERNFGSPECSITPKKLWTIVKELPNHYHNLQENDIIKLGRFKLRVKQLVKNSTQNAEVKLDEFEAPTTAATTEEMVTMQCRICLLEGNQENDPLICPCQCKGSIKFVHVECLRHWVNGKINISDDQQNTFFFRQINCELCKTVFPSSVQVNEERLQIVKVPLTPPPFIVLENINSHRGVHVISMAEKKDLRLGRGHESDVRIPDVSISRYHATIRFVNDAFQLSDNSSKFGTLVAMRRAYNLEKDDKLAVQVGRSMVMLLVDDSAPTTDDIIDASETLTATVVGQEGEVPSDTNAEPPEGLLDENSRIPGPPPPLEVGPCDNWQRDGMDIERRGDDNYRPNLPVGAAILRRDGIGGFGSRMDERITMFRDNQQAPFYEGPNNDYTMNENGSAAGEHHHPNYDQMAPFQMFAPNTMAPFFMPFTTRQPSQGAPPPFSHQIPPSRSSFSGSSILQSFPHAVPLPSDSAAATCPPMTIPPSPPSFLNNEASGSGEP